MPKLENTPQNHANIHKLLEEEYYIGNISSKGFIIKRNFGVRRLALYGKFQEKSVIISAKNEFLHQVFYIAGLLLFIFLIGLTLYQAQFGISALLAVFTGLILLDDYHRKNKEYKIFLETLEKVKDI
ncbi:MAG: hypothetical protein ACR2MS_11455 [Weeksellaceae bacterium]